MQDKELDLLFKNAFEEAEIPATPLVWNKLNSALDVPKKRKKYPFMWIAAASIAVFVVFGLMKEEESLKLYAPNQANDVHAAVQVPASPMASKLSAAETVNVPSREKLAIQVLPNITEIEVVELDVEPKKLDFVVQEIQEAIVTDAPITTEVYSAEVLTANAFVEPQEEVAVMEAAPIAKSDKIRNMGDLINLVVDKLDRRDQKAIRFVTQDDESSIVSFNIGPFKFNQRRN